MSGPLPYVSFVATARNDDHGGQLLHRMQLFIDGLCEQCDRWNLPAELVLVDWNPPVDKPPLAEALHWPRSGRCAVRVIQVPSEVHHRFEHARALPLFQMIAKNVGIRRARAPYVCATNIDILFSDALIRHMAQRRLRPGRVYRVNRHDVESAVPTEASVPDRLRWCAHHVIRVNHFVGTRDLRSGHLHRIHANHGFWVWWKEKRQDWGLRRVTTVKRLHTNACGDFTLAHRDVWADIAGYPEWPMYSMHLDSFALQAMVLRGARHVELREPMRTYHIEHSAGSGFSPEHEDKLNDRLKKAGIPRIGDEEYWWRIVEMRKQRPLEPFNGERWGLADQHFKEDHVTGPAAANPANPNREQMHASGSGSELVC